MQCVCVRLPCICPQAGAEHGAVHAEAAGGLATVRRLCAAAGYDVKLVAEADGVHFVVTINDAFGGTPRRLEETRRRLRQKDGGAGLSLAGLAASFRGGEQQARSSIACVLHPPEVLPSKCVCGGGWLGFR